MNRFMLSLRSTNSRSAGGPYTTSTIVQSSRFSEPAFNRVSLDGIIGNIGEDLVCGESSISEEDEGGESHYEMQRREPG